MHLFEKTIESEVKYEGKILTVCSDKAELEMKLELVDTMCLELIHKDGSSLLQDAGVESSAYPWDDAAYEKYTAVLDTLSSE